jgi:hypothetical protein
MIKSKLIAAVLLAIPFLFSFSGDSTITKAKLDGAWRQTVASSDGDVAHVLLFSGRYFSWTTHMAETGAFISTKGGSWSLGGEILKVLYEFDTADSARVGSSEEWMISHKDTKLMLEGAGIPSGAWKAIDVGVSTSLSGPWLFSGRERNGEITRRDNSNQPRKTMKILTGNRFQWIAYNTETKQFFGTGGGSYTAENGVYTENIEFFSRDNSRVGASLEFEFKVDGDDWHHRGKSSAGEPMYEIWSRRE